MSEPLIAIVDDDVAHLAMLQRVLLGKARVSQFETAEALLQSDAINHAHLIILDWNLPGMSGLDALRAVRAKRTTPVLFLTSFDAESKVVAALGAGADDYLVKPFRSGELMARIQTLLRRYQSQAAKYEPSHKELMGGVVAYQAALTLQLPNQAAVKLSNKEFSLAVLFFQNIGRSLSREDIVSAVWGRGQDVPSRTLDTHVSRLRSNLNLRPDTGWRLTPVYSFGYRLDKQDETISGAI
jgi:DNA-binding response OmpR family regulator